MNMLNLIITLLPVFLSKKLNVEQIMGKIIPEYAFVPLGVFNLILIKCFWEKLIHC